MEGKETTMTSGTPAWDAVRKEREEHGMVTVPVTMLTEPDAGNNIYNVRMVTEPAVEPAETPEVIKILDEPGSAVIGATLRVTAATGELWNVTVHQRDDGYGPEPRFVWTARELLDDSQEDECEEIFPTAEQAWWNAVTTFSTEISTA